MSIIKRKSKRKGGVYSKATKGTPTERAGTSCKEKGTERRKKVKEGRERRGSVHGQATRSAARIEEEFNRRVKEEGRGALWKRHPRRDVTIRIGMVHKGNDSDICRV